MTKSRVIFRQVLHQIFIRLMTVWRSTFEVFRSFHLASWQVFIWWVPLKVVISLIDIEKGLWQNIEAVLSANLIIIFCVKNHFSVSFLRQDLILKHFHTNNHFWIWLREFNRIRYKVNYYLEESTLIPIHLVIVIDVLLDVWLTNQLNFLLIGNMADNLECLLNCLGNIEKWLVQLESIIV